MGTCACKADRDACKARRMQGQAHARPGQGRAGQGWHLRREEEHDGEGLEDFRLAVAEKGLVLQPHLLIHVALVARAAAEDVLLEDRGGVETVVEEVAHQRVAED